MTHEIALEEIKPCCSSNNGTNDTPADDEKTSSKPLDDKQLIQTTAVLSAFTTSGHAHAPVNADDNDDDEESHVVVAKPKSKLQQHLHVLLEQVRSRHTWTVAMVTLGTLYMLTNLWNTQQMWNENMQYELVVGPPVFVMKILITGFTAVGTVMWALELVSDHHVGNVMWALELVSDRHVGTVMWALELVSHRHVGIVMWVLELVNDRHVGAGAGE